jgi:hypothetical protein
MIYIDVYNIYMYSHAYKDLHIRKKYLDFFFVFFKQNLNRDPAKKLKMEMDMREKMGRNDL